MAMEARPLKSVFGVIGACVPVIYCGYLLFYFLDLSGSVEEAQSVGLGPTMLGLGLVGLVFCIPAILKIIRLFARLRSPRAGAPDPQDSAFDADAVVARYKARQPVEDAPSSPAPPHVASSPAKRTSFGRKVR
jgi:hypothetical protein